MIQVQTEMLVADNTGAKRIECIKVWVDQNVDMLVLEIQLLLQLKKLYLKEKLKRICT